MRCRRAGAVVWGGVRAAGGSRGKARSPTGGSLPCGRTANASPRGSTRAVRRRDECSARSEPRRRRDRGPGPARAAEIRKARASDCGGGMGRKSTGEKLDLKES